MPTRIARPSEITVLLRGKQPIAFRYSPSHRRASTVIHCAHTARGILSNPYYGGVGIEQWRVDR